ncbi:hypothetical protein PG993_010254 [Apiospora rasikravindrae]|uniref:Uncharacterized protein n=1 Tax=Apiospora rasikravindrae TaxID=990691 RepID=A0ABR1SLT2_9PEZI
MPATQSVLFFHQQAKYRWWCPGGQRHGQVVGQRFTSSVVLLLVLFQALLPKRAAAPSEPLACSLVEGGQGQKEPGTYQPLGSLSSPHDSILQGTICGIFHDGGRWVCSTGEIARSSEKAERQRAMAYGAVDGCPALVSFEHWLTSYVPCKNRAGWGGSFVLVNGLEWNCGHARASNVSQIHPHPISKR